jgi:hypothetical protein
MTSEDDGGPPNEVVDIESLEGQKTQDIRRHRFREKLALAVTAMVGSTIIAAIFAAALSPVNGTAIKDIAVGVMPELIVAYGMIISFYFGTKH